MTKDLEETLKELGPEYRAVVDRLQAAYRSPVDAFVSDASRPEAPSRGHVLGWTVGYLVAASLLVALGVGVLMRFAAPGVPSESVRVYTAAYAADETALRSIVAAQRSDGSWQNDFLTRQNAAALANATDRASHIAYKKAVRYLRTKGLEPLSPEELRRRGLMAASRAS